ncbi:MAG: Gfo/Idh/MocA family oxidoreductase [Thaumarchaeota archaeon]|nr:Gfo/Idh/MocA family oxidoreductase [Nitrososphaerota archaeon]
MKIGIVGAGLQAKRRGPIVLQSKHEIVSITAEHLDLAKPLAKELGCKPVSNWMDVVNSGIDALLVCTPPHVHAQISIEAMKKGIHVLCEKPLCTTMSDAEQMVKTAKENNVILKCGFNHRYHPAIRQVKKWVDEGQIGEITFIRSIYGIGARPDVQKEWRSNPKIAAGGQLMEQGIHCIDLMRWFVGNPNEVVCLTSTPHSLIEPLEDNAFVTFKTEKSQLVNIHSSILQWKNHFSFEVFGTGGYAIMDGLGGSYGVEKAILGKRDPFGPFAENIVEFRGGDVSWKLEWEEFENSIKTGKEPEGNGTDGYESLRMVFAAYQSQREKRTVNLNEAK